MTVNIPNNIHTDAHRQVEVQDQLRREYGVEATGGVVGQDYHAIKREELLPWNSPRLKRITRLRLLSDVGLTWWDISYCHGIDVDGNECKVQLPMSQLGKSRNGKRMWAELYSAGNKDGVHVNRLFAGADISTLQ